jgi:type I restriction enzyme S subunit
MSKAISSLPSGWAKARVGDLIGHDGLFCDGDWVESKDQDPAGDVRLIQLADVGDANYRDRSNRFLTSSKAAELHCTYLKPGDLLVARMPDPLGRACIFPGDPKASVTVVDVCVVRVSSPVHSRWLMHQLNTPQMRQHVAALQSGSTRKRISRANFARIEFPLPPLSEQVRIADALDELLSDLDAGLAALDRVREKLELYRASVLKAAIEGALTAEWRKQHPQVEPGLKLLKRILAERRGRWEEEQLRKFNAKGQEPPTNWRAKYKEPVESDTTNQSELPTSYCWASFDQIGETQGGLQKSPSRKPTKNHYPYLRVANVHRGSLDLRELHRFELTDEELERLRLQPGDLLIVEGNGSRTEIGRCAMWRGEVEDCVHQNHLIRVRPLPGVIPSYVNLFLNSPDGQKAIQWVASSTSVCIRSASARLKSYLLHCHRRMNKRSLLKLSKNNSPSSTISKLTSAPSWKMLRPYASPSCATPSPASWCHRTRTTSRRLSYSNALPRSASSVPARPSL